MKIVSSTQTSATNDDDSFESLLARQKDRLRSAPHIPENHRPNGELQVSWKLDTKKKTVKSDPKIVTKEGNTTRRSASKNVFRKMGK
jgi:hypothetical protein